MSILDLGKVIFQPVDDLVAWMQGKYLLASSKTCPACNTAMVINSRADVSDGCMQVWLSISYTNIGH